MQLSLASRTASAASSRSGSRRRAQLQRAAALPQPQLSNSWHGTAAAAVAAAVLTLSPVQAAHAAQPSQLSDLLAKEYLSMLPAGKEGEVSRSQLQALVKSISSEGNLPLVADEQLAFSMRLFDLNQDGTLTGEELLRSLVLDGAVDDEAVDADVFAVFDSNKSGTVERDEFRAALGDLGPNGEAAKDFIFDRVDRLSESRGSLASSAFGNALLLARTLVLGY